MRAIIIKHTQHKRETTVHLELISSTNFLKVLYVCALTDSSQIKTNKCTNVKIIFFTHGLLQLWHVSIYLAHLQGVTKHQ